MIFIDPQQQRRVDGVAWINEAITISAVLRVVEDGKRLVPVRMRSWRLWSEVTKELRTGVDFAVVIPIKRKEGVLICGICPAHLHRIAGRHLERHPILQAG